MIYSYSIYSKKQYNALEQLTTLIRFSVIQYAPILYNEREMPCQLGSKIINSIHYLKNITGITIQKSKLIYSLVIACRGYSPLGH